MILPRGEFSSTHKYLGSHPEAADEESDVSIMADDEGGQISPPNLLLILCPPKTRDPRGATMEDSRRSFPPLECWGGGSGLKVHPPGPKVR